jgi:hypothetical protein
MRLALVALFYAVLTLVVFRPTWHDVAHTAPAFQGIADDPMLLMAATSHASRTLFRAPLAVFDAPFFYPMRYALAHGDHMIGQAIVGLPIWVATGNPLLEYNLLALGSYVAGATATWVYASALGASPLAATAAGLVFAFTPYRFHSPLWLQVLFTPFVPLTLIAWLRFMRTGSRAAWLAMVACWTMHGLMGLYLALYFGIVMSAILVYSAFVTTDPRRRRWCLAAPVAMLALVAPTLAPYVLLRTTPGHVRTFGLDTAPSFFLPGPGTWSARLLGTEALGRFGPGLLVWPLLLVGLARSDRARAAAPARGAHLVGLVVTLALVLVPIRFQLLVPGLDMVRATNRAFFLTLLFVAMFVADGLDRVARALPAGARRAVPALALVLLVLDLGTAPRERLALPTASDLPAPYRLVRDLPDDPVVYDQVDGPQPLARAMYLQIFHRKRLPTGYAGFWDPGNEYTTHRLFRFPAPESVRLLRALGIRWVLQHFPTPAAAEATAADRPADGLVVTTRVERDALVRIDPAPATDALPARVTTMPREGWRIATTLDAADVDRLRDGDATTHWGGPVTFGARETLTIDLGTARAVAGVRCTTPIAEAGGVHLSRIELSDDGERFALAPAGFEPDSLQALYNAPETIRFWEARFPPTPARFVRLTSGERSFWAGPWTIGELDVLVPAS